MKIELLSYFRLHKMFTVSHSVLYVAGRTLNISLEKLMVFCVHFCLGVESEGSLNRRVTSILIASCVWKEGATIISLLENHMKAVLRDKAFGFICSNA